jgi:hypothetical protein
VKSDTLNSFSNGIVYLINLLSDIPLLISHRLAGVNVLYENRASIG